MIPVSTLIFDMGGVLLDLDKQACVDAFAAAGYARAGEMLDPYVQSGFFLKLEEGKLTPEELFDTIRRESGKPIADRTITEALNRFIKGMPDYKLDMLRDLRGKGYQILMLSNTNAVMFSHIRDTYFTRQGLTIDAYFDRLFLSYEMKMVKPHEDIFRKLLADCGLEANDALFIDDGPANIETAGRLGFHTYLAKPEEDFRPIFSQYTLK